MNRTAYLIVICDKDTNAVLGADIWSSPEWMQSRCLPHPTYVAYEWTADDFASAIDGLLRNIAFPKSRYHWLLKHLTLDDRRQQIVQESIEWWNKQVSAIRPA